MPKTKKNLVKREIEDLNRPDTQTYKAIILQSNRELALVTSAFEQADTDNKQLELNFKTLSEDQTDVTSHLQRTIADKTAEIQKVRTIVKELEKQRIQDSEDCKAKITEAKYEYKIMCEELISTSKMLESKLNALDQFNTIRKDLLNKFEIQAAQLKLQTNKNKEEVYITEKKFVLEKHNLKNNLNTNIKSLSDELQGASEIRIASVTQQFVRKNGVLQREYNRLITENKRLETENVNFKDTNKLLKLQMEIVMDEKKNAVAKLHTRLQLIDQLLKSYESMREKHKEYTALKIEKIKLNEEKNYLTSITEQLNQKIKVIQENLHANRGSRNILSTQIEYLNIEYKRISKILFSCSIMIKQFLQNKSKKITAGKHIEFIKLIYSALSNKEEQKTELPLLKTILSLSTMYSKGDLGLVPKPVHLMLSSKQHKEVITSSSFENMVDEKEKKL
ncbi:hypothetical protein RN001_005912 [Aquatica leii]|uniref:Cilia- and flagella-associated protein 157 n=1 Tax=Aquatica leii TaxID=1421715 RepID=A0AAN7PDC6_9COLE|nr:hypothetical protein RN001_005912 [Aquatica leii]